MLVLIDHANIQATFSYNNRRVDWDDLRQFIDSAYDHIDPSVFSIFIGLPPNDDVFGGLRDKKEKFARYLEYSGFIVYTREGIPTIRDGAVVSYRADTDLLLVIHGLDLISLYDPSHVVIITGDNDFCTLVEHIRRQARRVTVAGLSSWIGSALIRTATDILDLYPLYVSSPSHIHQDVMTLTQTS